MYENLQFAGPLGVGDGRRVTIGRFNLKGLRPLPPTPADSRIFGFWNFSKKAFFDFSEIVDFGIFRWDLGVGRVCNG